MGRGTSYRADMHLLCAGRTQGPGLVGIMEDQSIELDAAPRIQCTQLTMDQYHHFSSHQATQTTA